MWKKVLSLLIAAAITAPVSMALPQSGAEAADFPTKPLRFHVGFPPGGSTDRVARLIAPRLEQELGQPVVLDNTAGAGGIVGLNAVAKADPDGHTFGFGVSGALTVQPTLKPNLPFDPIEDLAPVTMAVINPLVLVVRPESGIKTLQQFIEQAKSRPGMTYGTAGVGTAMHLAGQLLNQEAGIELTHVGYKGSGPALVDLLGGHVDSVIIDVITVKAHLEAGKLVPLGVTTPERTPLAPDIPTIAEGGVDGFGVSSWFGILTTAGTPPEVVARLNAALVSVLEDPEVSKKLLEGGLQPAPSSPEAFRDRIRAEARKNAELIKAAGMLQR